MFNLLQIIILCFTILASSTNSFAQSPASIEIDLRLDKADSLRKRLKNSDAWTQLSMISGLQKKMDTAQQAQYFKLLGVTQLGLGNFSEALDHYATSRTKLESLSTPQSKIDYVNLFTLEGAVYNKIGEYERAREIFLEGIEVAQKLPEKDRIFTTRYIYNNLAESYELLGQFDNAVKTNYSVLDILSEQGNEISVGAGVAHNNLGICYRQLGRYKLANEHYNKAGDIFSKSLGPNSSYTHAARGNAATAIDEYGDVEKAIPILLRKLDIYLEDPGADQMYITSTYFNLGWIYKRIGDYEKSLDAYERALGKLRNIGSTKKDFEIRILKSLALVEMHLQSLGNARLHLDEAFAIQEANNVLTPADLIRLYDTNATYYQLNHQKKESFKYIELSYHASKRDSLVDFNFVLTTGPRYIDALIDNKNYEHAHLVIDSTNAFILQNSNGIAAASQIMAAANLEALRVNLACAEGTVENALSKRLDKKLEEHTTKIIALAASTPGKKNQRYACTSCFGIFDVLESLANLHLEAYIQQVDVDGNHLQKALTAIDFKQRFLTTIWNNQHFSNLPTKEREHAKELRQRIAAYDLMIFENDSNSPAAQKQNSLYLDSILVLRPLLTSYIVKLGTHSIDFNQAFDCSSLDDEQGVLVYHQQANTLHVLSVTNNGTDLYSIPSADSIRSNIEAYSTFCRSESKGFGESLTTLALGAKLYNTLIPEKFKARTRIAIIESFPVEDLPFSALLTQTIEQGARGFRDAQFAIEKHAFSYHQSLSDFIESQEKSYYTKAINLTALAPSQVSSSSIVSTETSNVNTIGLTYATQEVEALIKKFKGTLLMGQQADFTGFLNAFKSSNVVHIASHATSNYSEGEYSYIIITDTVSLSGERLYARTIGELELPANLVVLGACESGSGKLRKGEGEISLSNIFLNAGAQSVVHTSWRVEDKKSQDVLLGFYDALSNQQPLDEALGQAQRAYLQTAGGQYLHPFYWAPFEVSGNLSPLESSVNIFLFGGIGLAALLALFLVWRSRS